MDRQLRVGIAGVAHGNAGAYANALGSIEAAALAAVWDADDERGQAFASRYGVAWLADLPELCGQVDALIVAAATASRPAIVTLAARAGLPVLCEPPLATTRADAEATAQACGQAGVSLGLAFPMRYQLGMQQLRQATQSGALGELLFMRAASASGYPAAPWLCDPSLAGGGAIMNQAGHAADLLRWISGREFVQVYAEAATRYRDSPVEDAALLQITLGGGLIASLDASWSRPASDPAQNGLTLEVTGAAGVAQIDAFAQFVEAWSSGHSAGQRHAWGDDLQRLMLEDWLRAVRSGGPAPVGPAEGQRALDLALAAYRSAALHEPVALD